jgi:hypothetical protein
VSSVGLQLQLYVRFNRTACRIVIEAQQPPATQGTKERAWRGMRLEHATAGVLCNIESAWETTHRGRPCICHPVHCSGQAVEREDRLAFVTATVVVL